MTDPTGADVSPAASRPGSRRRWAPIVLAVGATALVVASIGPARTVYRRIERERALARAEAGDARAMQRFLREGEPDALRRLVPGMVERGATGHGDETLRAFAPIGADAVPLMVAALADHATGPGGTSTVPFEHLLAHDPELGALIAAVEAAPESYRGLIIARGDWLAAFGGRGRALRLLAPLLEDTAPTNVFSSFTADAESSEHRLRVCDRAAEEMRGMMLEGRDRIPTPSMKEQVRSARAAHGRVVDAARAWWDEVGPDPELAPVGWVVVKAAWMRPELGGRFELAVEVVGREHESWRWGGEDPHEVGLIGPLAPGEHILSIASGPGDERRPAVTVPVEGVVEVEVDFSR